MSTFQIPSDKPLPILARVTSSAVATIVDGTDSVYFVPWFQVNVHSNITDNLTVDLYDGTNAHYLAHDEGSTWNARAVAPFGSYQFSNGIIVPKSWKLRVTAANASGLVHVIGLKIKVVT